MKLKVIQAPGALPTLRADGAAVIASEHEVLVRFYFDAPPYPSEQNEMAGEESPEVIVVREVVATVSMSPAGAHGLFKTLERLADDAE